MELLSLDKPLATRDPLVQLPLDLAAGVYLVSLRVVDTAGGEDEVQVAVTLVGGRTLPGDTRTPVPGPRLPGGTLPIGRPGAPAGPSLAPTTAPTTAPTPVPRRRARRKPPG